MNCETDFVSNTEEFKNLGNDIAMHIAATSPAGVSRDDISEEDVNKEKEIYRDQAKSTNKPDEIIEKMVEGRLNKFFKENVLLEQDFVKDSTLTIENLITNAISKLGENIVVNRFSRFQLGDKK